MAGNEFFQDQLRIMAPHTFNALQKLVTAMTDVTKNERKKTLFGRDKGQKAYSKFLAVLKATVQSMILDDVIQESMSTEEVLTELEKKLEQFSMAFPNWQDAYSFATRFFEENREDAIASIERLRSAP